MTAREVDWPAIVVAAVLLPVTKILLHGRGFQRTASLLASSSSRPADQPDMASAIRVAVNVERVAHRAPGSFTCLPRALTTWFILRRRGIDASIVVGAAARDGDALPAHAWVELEGEALNETAGVRERFGTFALELPRLAFSNQ